MIYGKKRLVPACPQMGFNMGLYVFTLKLIKNPFLISDISMTINPYNACNTFIYEIVFDLSELVKITLLKDIFCHKIEVKATENSFFLLYSVTLTSIII